MVREKLCEEMIGVCMVSFWTNGKCVGILRKSAKTDLLAQ